MVTLCVLFIRIPIMFPLWALIVLGDLAQKGYDWIDDNVPAWK